MSIRNLILAAAGSGPQVIYPAYQLVKPATIVGPNQGFGQKVAIARESISGSGQILVSMISPDYTNNVGAWAGYSASSGVTYNITMFATAATIPYPNSTLGAVLAVDATGQVYVTGRTANDTNGRTIQVYIPGAARTITVSSPDSLYGFFGTSSIAISKNGQRIFVGAPQTGNYTQKVFIYRANNTTATNITAYTLEATLTNSEYEFGGTLAIDTDGLWLAVGNKRDNLGTNSYTGVVRTYSRSGTAWTARTTIVSPQDINGQYFGSSLAMSADGTTLAISRDELQTAGVYRRSAYIYTRASAGTSWSMSGSPLIWSTTDFNIYDEQAQYMALSSNGSKFAVSAPYNNGFFGVPGNILIYENINNTRTLFRTLLPPVGSTSKIGRAGMGMNDAGTIVVASGGSGDVYVWNS